MRKVLVIIDMQNDFIDGALGNKECREVVPAVIDSVNNGEYTDIILTRDTHDEDYLNTQEGKRLPVVHCIKGTRGWQINEDILKTVEVFYQKKRQNMNEDCECKKPIVIDKPTFASLELGKVLGSMVVEGDIVDFCGVCTGICVISNLSIVKASIPEVTVRLIEKATACVTPESKAAAVKTAAMIQVDII